MKTKALILIAFGMIAAGTAAGEMVVQRWGSHGRVQHKSVSYNSAGHTTRMTVSLAPLTKGTKIYRSRLVFLTGEGYEVAAKDTGGRNVALKLVPPYDLWFDATDAVARSVGARQETLELTFRSFSGFEPEKTFLEIAFEGKLETRPQQVANLKAVYHPGQVFLTWREIWDIAGGNPEVRWGEMVEKVHDCTPLGIEPIEKDREIRYRVYTHTQPITPENIGQARLLYSVKPGSVYIEERVPWAVQGEHGPTYLKEGEILKRVTLEPDKPLPPGTGFHWHTVQNRGRAYYAVITAIDGMENTVDISLQNSVGEIGCWGMMEIERPDLYAYLHGWGQPEMTKGFQAWGRAQIWGAHFTEMGWPPFPRFLRAMIDTKRPFIYRWQVSDGRPIIRRNQSVPAFGNCSLDDNIGNGDLNNGYPLGSGQLNGYLNWDSETIVDEPDRWEMTVMLDATAPLDHCTVDLTPRKVRRFKTQPGQPFRWTCTFLPPPTDKQKKEGASPGERLAARLARGSRLDSGSITADEWGLMTIRQMQMQKGAQRVVIRRQ